MYRHHAVWRPSRLVFALLLAAALAAGVALAPTAWAFPGCQPTEQELALWVGTRQLEPVRVIVQEAGSNEEAEELVATVGGRVTTRLSIINAFVAEIPAEAVEQLAACPSVRAVTLDSGMYGAADTRTFTTWATGLGAFVPNAFTNADAMVDSSFGGNDTFGSGASVKGSFAGFTAEVTPGHAIQKVEILLRSYVMAPLPAGQDPILAVVVAGTRGKEVTLNHHAFDTFIGPSGADVVAVDMTGTRTWAWADFDKEVEVLLRQDKFSGKVSIFYDAIGLRVTSLAGTDVSADIAAATSSEVGPVDGTKQANVYNAAINATKVWNGQGYLQGNKVGVAIVDSGVVKTKDLKGRNLRNLSFSATYHNGTDLYGHGTFVAGIIAGNGSVSSGKYIGVAPKADYVNLRVSDDRGACSESDVVSALQWVYENHDKYNIRVVNLSLNSDTFVPYEASPLDAACEVLWFNGVVVVCSAGNNGDGLLYPPANDPFVITVGATDDKGTAALTDDEVAAFSAYGESAGVSKPELVAPGTNIVGLLPENGRLKIGIDHPKNRVDSTYFRMSGTSMAAPMVTGAVALLLQDEPGLTPDQVKYRLMATANSGWPGYVPQRAGAGYVDVMAAVNGVSTASANTGLPASPMLWTGDDAVAWDSVMWRSVMWRSDYWE